MAGCLRGVPFNAEAKYFGVVYDQAKNTEIRKAHCYSKR